MKTLVLAFLIAAIRLQGASTNYIDSLNVPGSITGNGTNLGSYMILLSLNNFSTSGGAITYFIGGTPGVTAALSTIYTNVAVDVPKSGTITRVFFKSRITGGADATWYTNFVNVNNGTKTALDTNKFFATTSTATNAVYTVSIPVVAGNTVAFQMDESTGGIGASGCNVWCVLRVDY